MLKYEAPHIYDIILKMTQPNVYIEPPYLLIKLICENANDRSFNKPKFYRYMEEYRNNGLYCKRPKIITPEREKYYKSIYKKKLEKYILINREKVERLRQLSVPK